MAGIIVSKTRTERSYSTTFLSFLFQDCIKIWFSRFKSNNAMVAGTQNEELVFDKLKTEDFFIDLFDVGLLQHKLEPTVELFELSPRR